VTDDTGATPDTSTPAGETPTPQPDAATPETGNGGESADGLRAALKSERDARKAGDKRARELESRLRELEDRDKTESEKLATRAAESERRAVEAEAQLLRLHVAADKGFSAQDVPLLQGTTRDEIEEFADALIAYRQRNQTTSPPPAGFDGGVRDTPAAKKPPEQAHNDFLLGLLGRQQR